MPIKPFVDRPEINLNYEAPTAVIITTGSVASPDVSPYLQGVSVRTSQQAFKRLLPFLSSNGYPATTREEIDHTLDRTTYGMVQLFIDSNDEVSVMPYNDIASLNDPVKFLQDTGVTAYPQVMLSPEWLNPGMMNGIIEPLEVRGTLPGASIDSPFVAHTVRGNFYSSPVDYIQLQSTYKGGFNLTAPFIDSQDTSLMDDSIKMHDSGISDFGTRPIAPFNDGTAETIKNDLTVQNESIFNDFTGVGIISKKLSSTFDHEPQRSVTLGNSGIRNSPGIDSIAFGGLLR